jgi:hypothetical protein
VLAGKTTAENMKARSVALVLTEHDEPRNWPRIARLGAREPGPAERYDLCILELNADDLLGLNRLLSRVGQWMEPGGKILVFHLNTVGTALATQGFIGNDAFWLDMPCRIHFAGSPPSLRAVNAFYQGIAGLRTRRLVPVAKGLARVSTACLMALRTSRSELVHSRRAPSVFTSFTLEIDIAGTADGNGAHREATHAAA